ncbi:MULTISPECIES: hypothetical protein [Rhodonellum]|nr:MULTISPECIES: hypothetical protein [Rhodonellum]SDZ47373.1 hypothetical protein SAMN05444412_11645 [Rhodonellum ikkaensis]
MKLLQFIICMLLNGAVLGQIYTDPAVAAAQAAHAAVLNNQLGTTNEKLTLIERGQLAITGNLTVVTTLQDKLFNGLSQVSSILTSLANIKEIARIATGIQSDVQDIMDLARDNPAFLVFAEQNATLFQQRAISLALEVNNFALQGGLENLMDAGERSKIIHSIMTDMMILRSYTYGMYRAMYFAKMKGLFKALNPFQGYIEMDLAIMEDIIRKRNVLSR